MLLTVVILLAFVFAVLLTVVILVAFVPAVLLTVVIFVAFVAPVLLTVFRLVLTVVTLVLTELRRLLIVVIFVVFVPVVLLTVISELLIVKTAPVFGIAVNNEPSPANLALIVPAEIVVKNPFALEIEFVEILQAVTKFVLTVFALMTEGIAKEPPPPPGTLVRSDPSPTNLA